jgi:DNA-binding transcriptional LysR family regulator
MPGVHDVELRRLRHLIAVAEYGNFGRAAAASYITQPALSRSIQALEAEVGAPLFDRRSSGVELTEMGRLLLGHAIVLDAAARDLDREIRLAKGLELGELRIGVGPWGGAALIAPAVGRLHSSHPLLRLRIVVAPWRELPDRLRARDVDLVVGAVGEIEPLADVETLSLSSHEMVVVGRVGHPLTAATGVTLRDVFAFPVIGPGLDADATEMLDALAAAAADLESLPADRAVLAIECDSSDVLTRILAESDALTFMPRFVIERDLRAGLLAVVADVDIGLRVRFGAAWLGGRTLGGAGTTLLDLLQTIGPARSRPAD